MVAGPRRRLDPAQVRAEAEQRWGPDVGAAVADDYRRRQTRRATAWVRSRQAGFITESVTALALKKFWVENDARERLAAEYQAAAAQREQKANTWLELNDDWTTTETDQAAAVVGFEIQPPRARWLVADHRQTAIKHGPTTPPRRPPHPPGSPTHHRTMGRPLRRHSPSRMGTHPTTTPTETAGTTKTAEQQRQDRGRGGLSL